METDKRVDSLENEFKLMRGELKQTLTSVRDYLLNLKLPPSQEATLLAAAMSGGGADLQMEGKFSIEKPDDVPDPLQDRLNEEAGQEAAEEGSELEEPTAQEEAQDEAQHEEQTMEENEAADTTENGGDAENPAMERDQGVPPVNLLANLIRWVSVARREIGSEQMATFLEVYGITGNLSPELKETILHLAELAGAEPAGVSPADTWSQLILELHGILAGDEAPRHPFRPISNGSPEAAPPPEEEQPEAKPMKLKLVFSGGDGKEKEFSVDLKPDEA